MGIIGHGLVGKELVSQLQSQQVALRSRSLEISVVATARSKVMRLGQGEEATDLARFGSFMQRQPGRAVIVDCTAADAPADYYAAWLKSGMSVVTPNKKAGSGPLARYKAIREAEGCGRFFFEASVGAGLPVIGTLQDMLLSGDKVRRIDGICSGTLSYLFNEFSVDRPWSEVVASAAAAGFTEPDPREDLSGLDVARKVTILARECGLELELTDVPVESLVPPPLQSWQPEDSKDLAAKFVEQLRPFDEVMAEKAASATSRGKVLRYVGSVDMAAGTACVQLRSLPNTHPFASTQYADNVIAFSSERYTPRPLVVQGPGAGAAVTAAGVFGDVLRAAVQMTSTAA